MKNGKIFISVLLVVVMVLALASAAALADGSPAGKSYDSAADFGEGERINIVVNEEGSIALDETTKAFNFIWIANSSKGTVMKINTDTCEVVGEYWTSPQGQGRNPSRTTVDHDGSVWVGNRSGNSVTKIGLVENGGWIDKDGDGILQASTGFNDIKPWTNAGGVDTNGGVSTAADESILQYVKTTSYYPRHLCIDNNNNLWVTAYGSSTFDLIESKTGKIIRREGPVAAIYGYGGVIGDDGVMWSVGSGSGVLRWDTAFPLTGPNGGNWKYINMPAYGIAMDQNGYVWVTNLNGDGMVRKLTPDGTLVGAFRHGNPYAQGVAVGLDNDIWVAHSLSSPASVGRVKNDGTYVGTVRDKLTGIQGITGVAVDAAGFIWGTAMSGHVIKIDPNKGPIGEDGKTPVGEVVWISQNFGGQLYNYSDMTGSTLTAPPNKGTWSAVYDSGQSNTEWGTISWDAYVANDGSVEVLASSSNDGINFTNPIPIENGQFFDLVPGRYIKTTVRLERSSEGESPVVSSVTVLPSIVPESITVIPDTYRLFLDETVTLTAVVLPENASYKVVTWTSSDTSVATVSDDGTVTGVTPGEATITATTRNGLSASCALTVTDEYTVTFLDWDGAVLVERIVLHKEDAEPPQDPERTGYTFTGWDVDFSSVTRDLTVTAQYSINYYNVIFADHDSTVLDTQSIAYLHAALAPDNPERGSYTFIGWDSDFESITCDLTVTARYLPLLEKVIPSASVEKLSGNKDNLTVVVTEYYTDGSTKAFEQIFSIANNAAAAYDVGPYRVYVDTKGNIQIRECYIAAGFPVYYPVTVLSGGNGEAEARPESAYQSSTVVLVAKPDFGYAFKEWRVISGDITLSGAANNPAFFDMPYGEVTVIAEFEQLPHAAAACFVVTDNNKTYNRLNQGALVSYLDGVTSEEVGSFTVCYENAGYPASVLEPINAGIYDVKVTTSGGSVFGPVEAPLKVGVLTIEKADPIVSWPVSAVITFGQSLSASTLTGGLGDGVFVWGDGNVIPPVSNDGYPVIFTPDDTSNYNSLTQTTAITVLKDSMEVVWPEGLEATYGQILADIPFPNDNNGVFSWTVPYDPVGDAGTQLHSVTFTPADASNFTVQSNFVMITVGKASGASVVEPAAVTVTCSSIDMIPLIVTATAQIVEYAIVQSDDEPTAPSEGWQESTLFTDLERGTDYYVFARTRENSNYKTGSAKVSDKITTLDMYYKEVIKPATCAVEGIMGIYCEDCDVLLNTETIALDAENHAGDIYKAVITAATCATEGIIGIYCEDCDALLGSEEIPTDADNHDLTILENGRVYCKDCGFRFRSNSPYMDLAPGQSFEITISAGESYLIQLNTDLFPDEIIFTADDPFGCLSVDTDTGVITCVCEGGTVILVISSDAYPELPPLIFTIATQ
jgi:streptogramin lyase